jgi:hypothetical protein
MPVMNITHGARALPSIRVLTAMPLTVNMFTNQS